MTLRMPAEWEAQTATWLAWPHEVADWPGKFETIPWVYGEIIRHLAQVQRVRLLVRHTEEQNQAQDVLERAGANLDQVDFVIAPTDRAWVRDSGPTFVRRGSERVLLDWRFNAWAKYDNWHHDDQVPEAVARYCELECRQPTSLIDGEAHCVVLEGGALEVNGCGTLLTTSECLLSEVQCRNPGLTREAYEQLFAEFLGARQVIWLDQGIAGDDTHGHIDDLARFVNPTTVVTVVEREPTDVNYAPLQANLRCLQNARDQAGRQLTVVELPLPLPLHFAGERLPASYANFLIANDLVLVPTFNDPNDRLALNLLTQLFPQRNVVGIHCGDLVWGLGTLHCASQQEIASA